MESVSHEQTQSQVGRLAIYRDGVKIRPCGCRVQMPRPRGGVRGNVTGFSLASAARMRDFFLRFDVPDSHRYAVTLTLPGKGWSGSSEDFRTALNAVLCAWRYQCPKAGLVWRVELQRRGEPHVHATVYGQDGDETALVACWVRYIVGHFSGFDCQDFLRHGVRAERCPADSVGWMRYCIDHASKHKSEQLGWRGRQWGVVGRSNFRELGCLAAVDFADAPACVVWQWVRYIQKLNRYPVTTKGADGKRVIVKYRRNRRLFGVSFLRGGGDMAVKLLHAAAYACRYKSGRVPVDILP